MSKEIAIYAGNPRLFTGEDGALIEVQTQPFAFRAALSQAFNTRASTGNLPYISLCFDHTVDFKNFTKNTLSNTRQNKPKTLADLKDQISSHFTRIAKEFDIELEDISIIREGSLKSKAQNNIASGKYGSRTSVDCGIIATELLKTNLLRSSTKTLFAYTENSDWSKAGVLIEALHYLQESHDSTRVQLNIVHPNKAPYSLILEQGEIIKHNELN